MSFHFFGDPPLPDRYPSVIHTRPKNQHMLMPKRSLHFCPECFVFLGTVDGLWPHPRVGSAVVSNLTSRVRSCSKSHGSGRVGSGSLRTLAGRVGSKENNPTFSRVDPTRSGPRGWTRPVNSSPWYFSCQVYTCFLPSGRFCRQFCDHGNTS